jgi:hypothetical protein
MVKCRISGAPSLALGAAAATSDITGAQQTIRFSVGSIIQKSCAFLERVAANWREKPVPPSIWVLSNLRIV